MLVLGVRCAAGRTGSTQGLLAWRRLGACAARSRRLQPLSTTASAAATGSDSGSGEHISAGRFVQVYTAPLARPVRTLKLVSVTSASLTLGFLPLSLVIGNEGVPTSAKIAVSSTVCLFAMATTGVLHWVTRAYVRSIGCRESDLAQLGLRVEDPSNQDGDDDNDGDDETAQLAGSLEQNTADVEQIAATLAAMKLEVETLTLFGRPKKTIIPVSEMVFPPSPKAFVSFYYNGRPFFVHPELARDSKLLTALFYRIL